VFLCHASADKPAVRTLHKRLLADGFAPWLDEEDILPGCEWQQEIPKAVRNSDVVVVCLSQQSIGRTGYVQKEIRYALDVADEQPEGQIFLIPLRLEECEVPERLSRWQWVDFFAQTGYEKLVRALHARRTSGSKTIPSQSDSATDGNLAVSDSLKSLKRETALLYAAILDSVRNAKTTGQAEMRNRTVRTVRADLAILESHGVMNHWLASPNLENETINRVDFKVIDSTALRRAIDTVERETNGRWIRTER
jgi:hypothetical protein